MKILWLSHLLPYPPKAGVIQRSYHLIRQLAQEHQVDVLAFHQPALINPLVDDPACAIEDGCRYLGEFCNIRGVYPIPSDARWFGREMLALKGLSSSLGYTVNWLQSTAYRKALADLLRKEKYDLVHLDTISFYPYFKLVAGMPVVLDHHNIESHMMFRRAEKEERYMKRQYFQLEAGKLLKIERKFCQQVQHNITCSDLDSDRLLEIAPKSRVSTVPNGVDTELFQGDRSSCEKDRLVFIGTMNWYPNVQAVAFLIQQIWPVLKARYPSFKLDIVGANAPESLVAMAGSDSGISFLGFVDDIKPIMNRALAFVCPISDGGGTKLKVLDALTMSLPLIAHPVACEGIAVGHGKSVLFAESAQDYVNSVALLIENEGLAAALGSAGRKLVEDHYSVAVVGRQLRSLYVDVVEKFGLIK